MKVLLMIITFFTILVILIFYIEERVSDLPKGNKIKSWWRRHIIGEDMEDENVKNKQ